MTRRLTAYDRLPQAGDVLRRGSYRIEIRYAPKDPEQHCFEAWDGRGITRIGRLNLWGHPHAEGDYFHVWLKGCLHWTRDGSSLSPVMPPFWYVSRADGGRVDVPIDGGAWC